MSLARSSTSHVPWICILSGFSWANAAQMAHFRSPHTQSDTIYGEDTRLTFHENHLHYSNLNGYGPDITQPHGMLIQKVFPDASDNFMDLLITTVKPYYSQNVSMNTVKADIASVNMEAGSRAQLAITFLDRVSREPVNPGPYALTFMNFDELSVTGCTAYTVSNGTKVVASTTGSSAFTFTSSARSILPRSAMDLSQAERAGSVLMQCNTESVSVHAKISDEAEDNLYIAGASNVDSSQTQQTCSNYECPEFYRPFGNQDELYCGNATCTSDDVLRCCYVEFPELCETTHTLMFPTDSLSFSNLGGMGPDFDAPEEGILYTNVFPESDEAIDMILNARSKYECSNSSVHKDDPTIADCSLNGLHGSYSSITVSSGSHIDLTATFRVSGTNQTMGVATGFLFTVYDFDEEMSGHGKETVTMEGYVGYNVSAKTTVSVTHETKNGRRKSGTFQSTLYGTESDNPKNPRKMSQEEMDKAVTFIYPANTSHFHITLAVGSGYSSRNFEFTGFSPIPCPKQAQCSSMECPQRHELKPDPDAILCAGETCHRSVDLSTCCQLIPSLSALLSCEAMICPDGFELVANAHNLYCKGEICEMRDEPTCCQRIPSFDAVCSQSRQMIFGSPEYSWESGQSNYHMEFGNVFPNSGRVVNLKVSVLNMTHVRSDMLSVIGEKLKIKLPHEESSQMTFHLRDNATGLLAEDLPEFYITLLGGMTNTSAKRRHIVFTGSNASFVSLDSHVEQTSNSSFYLPDMSLPERKLENMNLEALSTQARKSGVSFLVNHSVFKLNITQEEGASNSASAFDGVVLVGGSSSMTCATRATCSDYVCPSGFVLRDSPESIVCSGEACTADEYTACCDCDPTTSLLWLHSANQVLGELSGQDAIIKNVFPNFPSFPQIDLKIIADGRYVAQNTSRNMVNSPFLNLNFRTSTKTKLIFEFLDAHGHAMPVPFNFVFSIFDIDQQVDGGAAETFSLNNYEWYVITPKSHVVSSLQNETLSFHSSQFGGYLDNPVHPLALTDEHLSNSVSFMMRRNIARFTLNIEVGEGFGGRNLLFGGQSNLVCSRRAVCSEFQCPQGKTLIARARDQLCSGAVCTDADELRCCRDELEDMPPLATQPS